MEVHNLIDWICLSEQIKSNNNEIRNLTGEYKRIEPDCREGVRAQLECMKSLCEDQDNLYEKQNDLRGQKQNIERALERQECWAWRLCPLFLVVKYVIACYNQKNKAEF